MKEENKTKKIGRPAGSKVKDNVQLNMRYPRALDELVRADGVPSDVITPILMRHYGLGEYSFDTIAFENELSSYK